MNRRAADSRGSGPRSVRLSALLVRLSAMVCALPLLTLPAGRACATSGYAATVDPSILYQTFKGWGTSLAWWANVVGGFPEPARSEYIRKVFDPVEGLGLTVVRYNIGGGENPGYHFMEFRAAVPGFETAPGEWDWTADANQRWVLDAAMAAGADTVEAFSNSPPYWMTNSGSVTGAAEGAANLDPAYLDAFAEYLAEVALHFHDEWGVTFHSLEAFNEPVSGWWRFGGRQEGCHFDRGSQAAMIQSLAASMAARGLTTALSAPDENRVDQAVDSFRSYDDVTRFLLSQINTHTYGGSRRTELANLGRSFSDEAWTSEYGDGDASGLTLSRRILEDMKNLRPAAWVYWQAVDGGGWGLLKNALPDATTTEYVLNKKYFVMANYSRFIRPGYRLLAITDANSLAAFDADSGTLVIVTTNTGSSDVGVTYDLSAFDAMDGQVARYRTSQTEDLARLPGLVIVGGSFSADAAAQSVTTYVLSGVVYSGAPGFDPGDYYEVVNVNSGLSLDVAGGSTSDAAGIVQRDYDGGWSQQWAVLGLGAGAYKLVNRGSGLILDVAGASVADGASAIQFHDHAGTNQEWLLSDDGDGTFSIENLNSGLLLDVSGGSPEPGAGIVQASDIGSASQHWMLRRQPMSHRGRFSVPWPLRPGA